MSVSPIVLLVLFVTALVLPQTYGDEAKKTKPRNKRLIQDLLAELAELRASLNNKRCESGVRSTWFTPHDEPTGDIGRTEKKRITFSTPFNSVPMVIASPTYMDIGHLANVRLDVQVSNVDKTGFDVGVREWADTHTLSVGISWMACSN